MNVTRTQVPPTPRMPNLPPHSLSREVSLSYWLRRLTSSFTPFEGWLPFGLLIVALGCVVYSIIQADWVKSSNLLTLGAMFGLVVGLVIAKIPRLYQVILHLAACLIGYWWAVWITCRLAYHVPWEQLIMALRAVLSGSLGSGDVQTSEMVFFFYLMFLCFFLGYFGSWLVYRVHLPWLVVLVYGTITLVNLNYAKSDLFLVIVIQFVALLLLVARLQLASQILVWKQEGLYTDRSWLKTITQRCMSVATLLTIGVMLISSLFPAGGQAVAGEHFWTGVNNIVDNLAHGNLPFDNLTSLLRPYQTPTTFFSDQLTISGSVILPDGEVLSYESDDGGPHYLEGFTYSIFDGHTWKSALTDKNAQQYTANAKLPSSPGAYHPSVVKTTITMKQMPGGDKRFIFAPPQPRSFGVSTVVYSDVTPAVWTQQQPLMPGIPYEVVSEQINGNPEAIGSIGLPSIGMEWGRDPRYQDLINQGYTSIPKSMSEEIKKVTDDLVSSSQDSWSALKTIENYFNSSGRFSYSITNDPIPANVDVVTWLLQTRKGYCTYYASAMAIMARYLNIPTRIANGFNQGTYDAKQNKWIVTGKNAHSWVQAYFPNVGWVDFDPTPGFSPTSQGGATSQQTPVATPTTQASAPAIPTATATATHPVTNQQPTNPNDQGGKQSGVSTFFIWTTVLLLLGAVLFLAYALAMRWWRDLYAGATPISSTFWRVSLFASWFGLGPRRSQTPYEYGLYLGREMPARRNLFLKLADLFARERWGPPQYTPGIQEQEAMTRVWPLLRGAIIRRLWHRPAR